MYVLYSIIISVAFIVLLPMFILRREKYASGFRQRLGHYPEFEADGRQVIWLHCVSVGETNAARPLVGKLGAELPDHRLVISTTTKTGQDLARRIFSNDADAIIYFPFDWKFSVRRALERYRPSMVLLMETEIWPRFIRESKVSGAKVAIVNGRLSERSYRSYSRFKPFISTVLNDLDAALMQHADDATRIIDLGMNPERVRVSGNLKYDISADYADERLAHEFRSRFGFSHKSFVILGASTHHPEEQFLLDAFEKTRRSFPEKDFRLIVVPRHPERFHEVAALCSGFCATHELMFSRRSFEPAEPDMRADVVLLDSVGELGSLYSVADIVVVGGSMVPHGGQSVLEPAIAGKPIITGPFTHNFAAVVDEFRKRAAVLQLEDPGPTMTFTELLHENLALLIRDEDRRRTLSENAEMVMTENKGATDKTVEFLKRLSTFKKLN